MISVLSGILNSAEESEDINNSNGGIPCLSPPPYEPLNKLEPFQTCKNSIRPHANLIHNTTYI